MIRHFSSADSGMRKGLPGRGACALIWILLLAPQAFAQLQDESAVRAAFVFNLTKYVEWPRSSGELVIGFVGESSMGEILKKMLDGKASESRSIRVLASPSEEQLPQCNIVYIAYSSPKKFRPVLEKLREKGVLTVGDDYSFALNGGMVGLVRAGDHIQIMINLEVVQESGLKISSRVLSLAAIVRTSGGG